MALAATYTDVIKAHKNGTLGQAGGFASNFVHNTKKTSGNIIASFWHVSVGLLALVGYGHVQCAHTVILFHFNYVIPICLEVFQTWEPTNF